MKTTLEMVNRMRSEGIIGQYAIGGAVGATFYLEPSATLDVDIFIDLPRRPGSSLVSLAPIYDYLEARGCSMSAEHIVIGDWPVQFLPAATNLEREALAEALETDLDGVPTRVMSAEHLAAIALQTGRTKDHNRIVQFLELEKVDVSKLNRLLERHGLTTKWERFKRKYLAE